MLGLTSLTEKLKKEAEAAANNNNNNNNSPSSVAPSSGGGLRKMSIRDRLLIKEVAELDADLPPTCKVNWDDPDKVHDMNLTVTPDEGLWKGGVFQFHILVPDDYNMSPPTVKCKTKVWHPNINEEGAICLSLLRQSPFDDLGWAPTRRIRDVIWGLNQLFTDLLNFDEPLNHEAANEFKQNPDAFGVKVKKFIRDSCQNNRSSGSRR